jgi:hypothetical protein
MILRHPVRSNQTKLHPHKVGADVFADIVFGRLLPRDVSDVSVFDDNYLFFLKEVQVDDVAARAWKGLNRLEHVAITLRESANPQQIFESLNSTGAPLASYELIHNYILMGLSHSQQTEIEESSWVPIEENTGEEIEGFWRDYLIMRTGRDTEFIGPHGVYDVFRNAYPRLRFESVRRDATEWRAYSDVYRVLLDPAQEEDQEIQTQLGYVNTFGGGMYPLLLAVYREYQDGARDKSQLIEVLERLQSLWLRRMVVGQSRDHLAAQLCRRRIRGARDPIPDILRRTPADERIRHALRYRSLPHAGYVLDRIERARFPEYGAAKFEVGLEIEHVFPQGPSDGWSGDEIRAWAAFMEDERSRYRELLSTLGNIALLEQPLNAGASNKSFHDKKPYYRKSRIPSTYALASTGVWDVAAIEKRAAEMTEHFLAIWHRPPIEETPGELVPVLDIPKKGGWYQGWKTEFEYAQFQEEMWEVHNILELRVRVYQQLLNEMQERVLEFDRSHHENQHIREMAVAGFRYERIGESLYLYNGWVPHYLLGDIQELLDELGLADELWVKFTSDQE